MSNSPPPPNDPTEKLESSPAQSDSTLDVASLLGRVRRAFSNGTAAEVASQYRAIIGPSRTEDLLVRAALEAMTNGKEPSPLGLAALEEAIRVFRPAILSERRALPMKEEHRSAFPAWNGFVTAVAPHLYAIGRIDAGPRAPTSVPRNIGTGFLVSPTALVTNRHVLELLSLSAMRIERGMAVVNFQAEHRVNDDEAIVDVVSLLAVHPSLDLALFKIAPREPADGRTPLVIVAATSSVGQPVAAVGYPFQDVERNPLFVDRVFQGVYGMKRAAPGEIIGVRSDAVHHDCSTLGGNSGSPLLDMTTAEVRGVQTRGGFLVRNTAVAGAALAEFVAPFLG